MYVCLGASTFQMSHHCLLHYSKEQNNAVGLEVVLFGDFFSPFKQKNNPSIYNRIKTRDIHLNYKGYL